MIWDQISHDSLNITIGYEERDVEYNGIGSILHLEVQGFNAGFQPEFLNLFQSFIRMYNQASGSQSWG